MIYLDYAANHPADPGVVERFCRTELAFPGNPSSAHSAGRAAREELDRITASIAALLGAEPEEVIYTSGATESNNLAIKGLAQPAATWGGTSCPPSWSTPRWGGSAHRPAKPGL